MLVLALLAGRAASHSWIVSVGADGRSRGGIAGGDHALQRYACPLETLEQCQPDPKHGIVLTEDAMRPCRHDAVSDPMAAVEAGEAFALNWMGNGHAGNGQSDGTCVRIRLAPFAQDPEVGDFGFIGYECVDCRVATKVRERSARCMSRNVLKNNAGEPTHLGSRRRRGYNVDGSRTETGLRRLPSTQVDYWRFDDEGKVTTSAEITLPPETPAGTYTLHWMWDFTDFWFQSCADITVTSGSPAPPPDPTDDTSPSEAPTEDDVSPPDDDACEDSTSWFLNKRKTTRNCQWVALKPSKRCPKRDAAERCLATCGGCDPDDTPPSPPPALTTEPPTTNPPTTNPPTTEPTADALPPTTDNDYFHRGCAGTPFCETTQGTYCKDWQSDECGRSVCHGDSHALLVPCAEA